MESPQVSGEAIPFPTGTDWRAWAKALVNALRRENVKVADTVTKVVEPLTEDREAALEAAAEYAEEVSGFVGSAGGLAQSYFEEYQTAAAAQQAALAQQYLTQAVNVAERSASLSDVSAVSTDIDTVAAYLAGTAANIETIRQAVADGDDSIASLIENVQSQADGNTSAVSTLVSAVSGISARWGVSVNLNGHVAGLVRLDGDATGSTFTVVADKFIVAHPSSSGTLMTPFIVGEVGGVSTVAINGALIVDGTISARHIDVTSLSAISTNIGTVTAGLIQSTDGNSYWNLATGDLQIG
jgi:hypothetical protein